MITEFLAHKFLGFTLCGSAFTQPTTLYMALATFVGTGGNTFTEVASYGYTRKQLKFGAPVSGGTANNTPVAFPTATGNWGYVAHYGVYDASSGGNLLFYGDLTQAKTITSGDIPTVAIGELGVSVT